ncbi:CTP synthase-like [Trichogramma pretiosum]|uniref:CTP synthase-like n=1 Tax=Trichogramma pretiosum TaxID=7493 RepID=UPI000C71C7D8|nr:CTP synthase-like [Trichogramma pretiosum]
MKYILVTGGVISGVGKGVIASSFGAILKSCGLHVTSIKIDPYLNIDAGTFSPYEHGEVYVLDDGGEVDLDLGNYERFLDVILHKDNNITTGKIYEKVIRKERKGDYLGKTVQIVPHTTNAITEWVEEIANRPVTDDGKIPDVCIVELGGTIGDMEGMPFVEAFRRFKRVQKDNFCCAHVSYVPTPKAAGEAKSKPTQASVRELRGLGLSPDLIICRSDKPIGDEVKEKISHFCDVEPDQVIKIHDLPSIYEVPLLMVDQGVMHYLNDRLELNIPLPLPDSFMSVWKNLAHRVDLLRDPVEIALVGKYTKLEDAYKSVIKSLEYASIKAGRKLTLKFIDAASLEEQAKTSDPVAYHAAWKRLCSSDGVVVPGGFGSRGVNGKMEACRWCREHNIPFLGICLGFQTAVMEFSKNVLHLDDVNSTEFAPDCKNPVVIDMPEHNNGDMGGTMRLGKRETRFVTEKSVLRQLYGNVESIEERHRHRYEVNPKYVSDLEAAGLKFVGRDVDNIRMEIIELENHDYFVATQFHPEYLSRPMAPSPPFLGLILASVKKLKSYLANGSRSCSSLGSVNSDKGLDHLTNGNSLDSSVFSES